MLDMFVTVSLSADYRITPCTIKARRLVYTFSFWVNAVFNRHFSLLPLSLAMKLLSFEASDWSFAAI